ncbi:MAG: carboxymuconolactone decarboxylase family protein [Alphaproteobacteria bacterium]
MPRLTALDPAAAEGKAKTLLDGVQKALGVAPNLMRTLAHSPAALDAYLSFGKALGAGRLGRKLGEQIALAVAGVNGCDYCASAHTLMAKGAGVAEDELARNLGGWSSDPKVAAALAFAVQVTATRGFVSDDDIRQIRDAGYGDGEIAEIVGAVALNTFSNYFNHIAETEVDFPFVPANGRVAA